MRGVVAIDTNQLLIVVQTCIRELLKIALELVFIKMLHDIDGRPIFASELEANRSFVEPGLLNGDDAGLEVC